MSYEEEQIKYLVKRLAEAEARIQALALGQADAIIEPLSAAPILLRQAQKALLRSESRYRSLLSNISTVICELVPEGNVIFVNDAVAKVTGYKPEELSGKNWWEVFYPGKLRGQVSELFNQLRLGNVSEREMVLAARDGSPRTLLWNYIKQFGQDGRIISIIGFGSDITERKRTEDSLKAYALRQAAVADLGQKALAGTDLKELMDEAVRLVARTLDVEYAKVLELLPDGKELLLRAGVGWKEGLVGCARVDAGTSSQAGFTLLSNEPVIVEDLASETRFSGPPLFRDHEVVSGMSVIIHGCKKPFGVLGTHTTKRRKFTGDDIAFLQAIANILGLAIERRRAEDERASLLERERNANQAKDEFLAILSHELRNPLTPVLGWARILNRHSTIAADAQLFEAAKAIERNALSMARLIEDCLDLVRIAEGKIRLEKQVIDLNQIARTSIRAVETTIQSKDLRLEVKLSPHDLPILADPVRIEEVIMNLLTNATKYTESGGLITVSSSRVGDEAEISVEDTGIGIAPEYLEQIFEPFRQGTSSWLTSRSGLGLGLAIARQIILLHGGRIWAESSGLGQGSRFIVRLPLAQEQSPGQAGGCSDAPGSAVTTGLKILLVEDSEDILELLKIELERMGYIVLAATDGQAALELARREKPALVISDIKMPGLSGYDLIQLIRQIPGLESMPAIALTGLGMREDIGAALAAGYSVHLTKPVDPDELGRLIRWLTAGK